MYAIDMLRSTDLIPFLSMERLLSDLESLRACLNLYREQARRTFRPGMPEMENFINDAYLCRFLLIVLKTHSSKVWQWASKKAEQQEGLAALSNDLKKGEDLHSLACSSRSSCQVNFSDIRRRAENVLESPQTVRHLLETYTTKLTSISGEISLDSASLDYEQFRSTACSENSLLYQSKSAPSGFPAAQTPFSQAPGIHTSDPVLGPEYPSIDKFPRTTASWSSLRKVSSIQSLRQTLRSRPSFASSSTTLVGQAEKPRSLRAMLSRRHLNISVESEVATDGLEDGSRKGET